jgi:hypothetical protein
MKPIHFVSAAERAHYVEFRRQTLQHDADNPPKPKLRCRIFGHKWFSHQLPPGSRTICWRCKVNPWAQEQLKALTPREREDT